MKQSRIADNTDDLANRIALNSRYYLKPNRVSDVLITDEVAKVIYQESRVSLTQVAAYTHVYIAVSTTPLPTNALVSPTAIAGGGRHPTDLG